MIKEMCKKNWQILLFNILIVLAFTIFYGRFGDVIVDSFREAYIPAEILKGQLLYKNIFTIYTPFAYLFNALLFFIFGINLKVLYFASLLATVGICNLTFIISNRFMHKNYSLAVVLFIIAGGVLSPNVFNFFFPYSYGVLYGLLFTLACIYFALNKKFFPAYLMYSFAICSKYEFILLLPLLIYASGKKGWLKNITAFILPLIITFTPLFIKGLQFKDLITACSLILTMSSTKTLYWFYSVTGLVFRWELIPIYIINFLKLTVPLVFFYYFRNIWLIIALAVYFYFIASPESLIFVFPLILILFAIKFHSLGSAKKFIILASLLASIKLFFAFTLQSYGVFFIPFALIPLFILIPKRFKKSLFVILLLCAFSIGIKNTTGLINKNVKIKTPSGIVYATKYNGNSINKFINYINTETLPTDRVLVYPENLAINFLTQRESDNKFYSLIPLYVETFGEDIITGRFELTRPEYIIISNYNTSNYYYSYFGQDYAGKIFEFVLKNYEFQKQIGEGLIFNVYRIKPHYRLSQPRA